MAAVALSSLAIPSRHGAEHGAQAHAQAAKPNQSAETAVAPPNAAEAPPEKQTAGDAAQEHDGKGEPTWTDLAIALSAIATGAFTAFLAVRTSDLARVTERLWEETKRLAEGAEGQSADFKESIAAAIRSAAATENSVIAAQALSKTAEEANRISAECFAADRVANHKQLRAYILVEVKRCKLFGPTPHFRLTLEMRNTGQTPALNVRSVFTFLPLPYQPPLGTLQRPPSPTGGSRSVIAANQKKMLNKNLPPISDTDLLELDARGLLLHFHGIVEYEDVFGSSWETEYCFFVRNPHLLKALRAAGDDLTGNRTKVDLGGFATTNQGNRMT